jgi:hypothetical protein
MHPDLPGIVRSLSLRRPAAEWAANALLHRVCNATHPVDEIDWSPFNVIAGTNKREAIYGCHE